MSWSRFVRLQKWQKHCIFICSSSAQVKFWQFIFQLELKKTILDRMVHLLSRGYVLPVVGYIRKCLEKLNTDISLIRYFVTEVRIRSLFWALIDLSGSFFIMTSVSLLSLRLVFSSLFHFGKVLDVITPPYTSDFVQLFLPILENDSIAGTIRTEGEHDPVAEFIGELFLKWKYAWWYGTCDVFSLSISKRGIILSRGTMTCGADKCNSELCRFMLVTLGY